MIRRNLITVLFILCGSAFAHAQTDTISVKKNPKIVEQKDLKDVIHSIFKKRNSPKNGVAAPVKKAAWSLLPAVGYTANNGGSVSLGAAVGFYTGKPDTSLKMSNIYSSVTYTTKSQTLLPFQANIWSKTQKYNLVLDWKYVNYPSDVWGLGGRIDPNTGYTINFSGLKLHQSLSREIFPNSYLGVGYYLDDFWNIKAIDQLNPKVQRHFYRIFSKNQLASGIVLKAVYDNRLNQINPQQGFYFATVFRNNFKAIGSDENWNSLLLDTRTYLKFPRNSKNILAFWVLGWYTSKGSTPYFLMPSTGWDDSQNTGRGIAQGRYRGWDENYVESEYRFHISRNGLIGGVVFGNAETFPKKPVSGYSSVYFGYGLGLRLKLNKLSNTNISIDFGFGQKNGLATNLGEVF